MRYPDLIGQTFGSLTVLALSESQTPGKRRWICQCECGNTHVATTGNLKSGHTTHCGCKRLVDLTGKRFGKLTVLGRSDRRGSRGKRTTVLWECRCDCGQITYKATDVLHNPDISMCKDCAQQYAAGQARKNAGFVEMTQLSKILDMTPNASNTSGVRGVYYEGKFDRWRAEIKFQRKRHYLGSFKSFDEAVKARQLAEEQFFGEFLNEYASKKK